MGRKHSWLDRVALSVFNAPVMWSFLGFLNLFTLVYVLVQERYPFDPYPYTFLNLILAIFVAEMDVIIVIAQIVAGYRTDEQTAILLELAQRDDQQTALALELMQNTITMMRELEAAGQREVERDAELHQMIRDGQERGRETHELAKRLEAVIKNRKGKCHE